MGMKDLENKEAGKSRLRLSVLDQSPVPAGSTPGQALQNSVELARRVDELGYRRFWMSEHHAMDTLACTAPEIMLARIGAETKRIRIGSGGIMLPHYTPLKVAEVFRTLHALYPDRVDLGIGRAPGGGPVEALALKRERKTRMPDDFPEQVSELLAFLGVAFLRGIRLRGFGCRRRCRVGRMFGCWGRVCGARLRRWSLGCLIRLRTSFHRLRLAMRLRLICGIFVVDEKGKSLRRRLRLG